jgi:hypothetical protein
MTKFWIPGRTVTSKQTLRGLAKAGHITWPTKDGTKFHYVGRGELPLTPVYIARLGEVLHLGYMFTYRPNCGPMRNFALEYFDGCFCPFVVELEKEVSC